MTIHSVTTFLHSYRWLLHINITKILRVTFLLRMFLPYFLHHLVAFLHHIYKVLGSIVERRLPILTEIFLAVSLLHVTSNSPRPIPSAHFPIHYSVALQSVHSVKSWQFSIPAAFPLGQQACIHARSEALVSSGSVSAVAKRTISGITPKFSLYWQYYKNKQTYLVI